MKVGHEIGHRNTVWRTDVSAGVLRYDTLQYERWV